MKMFLEAIIIVIVVSILTMAVLETHDNIVKLRLCEMGVEI